MCGVFACVFFWESMGEMVTGFYRFHLCPSFLAMCESSGLIFSLVYVLHEMRRKLCLGHVHHLKL